LRVGTDESPTSLLSLWALFGFLLCFSLRLWFCGFAALEAGFAVLLLAVFFVAMIMVSSLYVLLPAHTSGLISLLNV